MYVLFGSKEYKNNNKGSIDDSTKSTRTYST